MTNIAFKELEEIRPLMDEYNKLKSTISRIGSAPLVGVGIGATNYHARYEIGLCLPRYEVIFMLESCLELVKKKLEKRGVRF
jgi:hypothetical protein